MSYSVVKSVKVDSVSKVSIDSVADVMIQNDSQLLPQSGIKPSIWCCRWYNTVLNAKTRSEYCYKRGDAVWINTEDLEEFTQSNQDYIQSIAARNGMLKPLLTNAMSGADGELLSFLMKIVSGEVTGNSQGYPLYYLGDIKQKTKIRVSLSDDNDAIPSDDAYWKDFFVDSSDTKFESELLSTFQSTLSSYMQSHLEQYHLSGIESWWRDQNDGRSQTLSSQYLLKDFSNVTDFQEYSPAPGTTDSGFDYVVYYQHKQYADSKTCKWFRVWKSGFLEHGGIVKNDAANARSMGDQLVYLNEAGDPTCYRVNLAWDYSVGTAPIYQYPVASTGFYYDDERVDFGDGTPIQLDNVGLNLDPESRYSVQVTPFIAAGKQPYQTLHTNTKNGRWYMSREVNSMCNDSFAFILDPDVTYYSYKVIGFSPNSQQRF